MLIYCFTGDISHVLLYLHNNNNNKITKQSKMKCLFRTHKFYWYFTAKQTIKKNHDEQSSILWEEYNSNLGPCGDSFRNIVGNNRECKLSSFFFILLFLFFFFFLFIPHSIKQPKVEYFLIYYWVLFLDFLKQKCLFHLCYYLYLKFEGWK